MSFFSFFLLQQLSTISLGTLSCFFYSTIEWNTVSHLSHADAEQIPRVSAPIHRNVQLNLSHFRTQLSNSAVKRSIPCLVHKQCINSVHKLNCWHNYRHVVIVHPPWSATMHAGTRDGTTTSSTQTVPCQATRAREARTCAL